MGIIPPKVKYWCWWSESVAALNVEGDDWEADGADLDEEGECSDDWEAELDEEGVRGENGGVLGFSKEREVLIFGQEG